MLSNKQDLYNILGISKNADTSQIKKSYRKLAHLYHPDKNPGNKIAEEKFKEICEAYSILSNPQKRRSYDQFGQTNFGHDGVNSSSININDIFGDIFGDIFNKQDSNYSSPQRGHDIHYSLNIEFAEAIFGTVKTINIPRKELCFSCKGSGVQCGHHPTICPMCKGRGEVSTMRGFFAVTQTCRKCNGSGKHIEHKCSACNGEKLKIANRSIKITIPKGIDHGMKIKINNEGESGLYGGLKGDLYVLIYIKNHVIFRRQGNDILCDIPILCTQAILGCKVKVPTINGKVEMLVPEGTQTGVIFRLKGRGVPSLRKGHSQGDQLVRIQVETPQRIDDMQKKLIKNFENTLTNESTPKTYQFIQQMKTLF